MPNDQVPAASTPSGNVTRASAYARSQLDDALALSGYAVSAGVHSPGGDPLPFADIGVIQGTAAKLGVFDPPAEGATSSPAPSVTAAEWVAFEQAYYRLAVTMTPVTAETLASTQTSELGPDGWLSLVDRIFGNSPALRFTRRFALVAIGFGAFVIGAECLINVYGQETDASKFFWQKNILQSLLPWAYGALGSCAYLLRSAHYFIYQRSFDLRRKPEYFNRVLLGAISGGAIILFVNYLVDEDGTVLHLSSAALGFVAGYSTDFLFNAIERVVAAIFPKTESDPKAQPQLGQRPPGKKPTTPPPSGNSNGKPPGPGQESGPNDSGDKPARSLRPAQRARKPSTGGDETGSREEAR
ncbi:MAG: hypothetical protein JWR80_4725 [Bradyrhizobium sp.]|nr:hypothetical protein [Bradyrhizobium sp.]